MPTKEGFSILNNVLNNSAYAAWATAFATLFLAIVAIFQDKIRTWIKRPNLNAEIICAPPDCHYIKYNSVNIQTNQPMIIDSYFFRMRIINNGNSKANNVEVYAYKLEKKQIDNNYKEITWFLPLNLTWTHFGIPFIPAISPKMEKHCDLFLSLKPESILKNKTLIFLIATKQFFHCL
jgi:hypothetical protein